MAYIVVENFSGGLDDRKSILTSAPGTLVQLDNAHLTPGGEIEKRKAFHLVHQFAPGQCLGGRGADTRLGHLAGIGARPANLPPLFAWHDVEGGEDGPYKLINMEFWTNEPLMLVRYGAQYEEYGVSHCRLWYEGTGYTMEGGGAPNDIWGFTEPAGAIRDMIVMYQKVFLVRDSLLFTSGVADPLAFGTPGATGSAVYDISHYGPKAARLAALAAYQDRLLALSRNASTIWALDPDPDLTSPIQFIDNFGCVATRSLLSYGEADTFFLSDSGIRSVRARDASNVATVNDIGSPINTTILNQFKAGAMDPFGTVDAVSVYEPQSGRFWMAIDSTIYVLSFYPGAKVTAWSTYTLPFKVVDMFNMGAQTFVLGDNGGLYTYGKWDTIYGSWGDKDYDDTEVTVELPFLDAGKPGHLKQFSAMDATLENQWRVYAGMRVAKPGVDERVATVTESTFDRDSLALTGQGTHLKLRLTHQDEGYARLSNVVVHYKLLGAD